MKIQKIFFLIAATLLLTPRANAQNPRVVDSLTQLINTDKADTVRIIHTMDLAWHYRDSEPEKFISLTNRALEDSKKINYNFGISKAYILLGIINTIQGDFPKAEEYYLLCKNIKEKMRDSLGIASVLNNLGLIQLYQSSFEKALSYFMQSLAIEEKFNDRQRIAETYVNMGNVYMGMKNYDKALEYNLKYLEINKGTGDQYAIPEVFANLGQAYMMKKETEKARSYFMQGIEASRATGNKNMEASCLTGMAAILTTEEKFEDAVALMKQSIQVHETIDNKEELTNSLNQLGIIYNKLKDYDAAIAVLYKSISISRKIGLSKNIADAYFSISESYEKKKDFQNAFQAMSYYSAYTDSVLSEKNRRIIAEMEAKFQNEKKAKENVLLTQENEKKELQLSKKQNLVYLAFGLTGFIILGSLFFYNRNKLKQQQRLNEEILLQEKLRLNAIINTQENERKRIAGDLHDGLGQMLSAVRVNAAAFENKIVADANTSVKFSGILTMIDESCKEVRNISHNMMPVMLIKSGLVPAINELASKLSAGKSLSVMVHADENMNRLPPESEINLFRITQELLNNILKHAGASEISISCNESQNYFTLMIEDNGKFFDKQLLENSKGNGWYNIHSRLKMMNGKIEIDSHQNQGTVVTVEIPQKPL